MDTATMRFMGDLNDLLAPAQRMQEFKQPTFDGSQTVKHLIEANGVPHTEVGWVIVNGRSVDFSHRVQPGESVIIYPMGSKPEIRPLLELRPPLPEPIRFLLDNHLGRLARMLRLLGLNTLYYNNELDDEQLAQKAHDDNRVLLTRDRGLLKRSLVIHGCCLRTTDSIEQLHAVLERFDLTAQLQPWTRCLRCNGLLEATPKQAIIEQIEPRTRRYYDDFYVCADCGQIYWRGSHFPNLDRLVQSVWPGPARPL
jgi:uncharacterized protein with PIN domain